jgi:murein DD-endopeptidase MepM/ murein hydrolase activator NlpD
MRRRRRRVFREEVLAPWLTLAVILGLWWIGAYLLGRHPGAPHSVLDVETAQAREREPSPSPNRAPPSLVDAVTLPVDVDSGDVAILLNKQLQVPVAGVTASSLRSTFRDARGGSRQHEALDILAPRGTPVVAAIDGRIMKLFTSARGGLTIYQYDLAEQYCYYYAHLDGYVANLTEGQTVARGETIGYVGTTGNAPPNTPHLHFAIFKLDAAKRWWEGVPLDPFLVLR